MLRPSSHNALDYRGGRTRSHWTTGEERANRLAGPRARVVRSPQASEPSSAASLGKNGYGDPAAAPLDPDGYGPTQPQRSGPAPTGSGKRGGTVVSRSSSWNDHHEPRVEPAACRTPRSATPTPPPSPAALASPRSRRPCWPTGSPTTPSARASSSARPAPTAP